MSDNYWPGCLEEVIHAPNLFVYLKSGRNNTHSVSPASVRIKLG